MARVVAFLFLLASCGVAHSPVAVSVDVINNECGSVANDLAVGMLGSNNPKFVPPGPWDLRQFKWVSEGVKSVVTFQVRVTGCYVDLLVEYD